MSGLLQRLAARATGSAWALRSDARLPFASAPAMAEVQAMEPIEAASAHRPAQAGQAPAAMSAQIMVPFPEPTPPLARAQQMAAAEEPPATALRPTPRQLAAAHIDTSAQPPALGDRPRGSVATAHRPVTGHAPEPLAQRPTPYADPAPLLPTASERGTAKARQTAAGTAQPGTPRTPHALQPLRQPLATPATASEPTEVHVHIGRIEVTAITQPQAQKRAARERSQPLSLDAYLARRKEPS